MEETEVIEEPTEAEPSEESEQIEDSEPSPEPPKKENKVQARIDEITRARRQAEAEAEYWRKVATEKQPIAPEPARQEILPPNFPAKPTVDQFEDYDTYVEALGEWSAERTIAKREYARQQQQQQEAQQTARQTYAQRVEAAKAKYADWDEVVAVNDVHVTNVTLEAILESEQGPDISYYLLSNPQEADRLNKMSQIQQLKEIGKLETKMSQTAAPVKRVSQAPKPINPSGGTDAGIVDMDKLEGEAWAAAERERVRKLGRRY